MLGLAQRNAIGGSSPTASADATRQACRPRRPAPVSCVPQAIPLNLNDLERITGGNMMVRPELPYSPGMEVMGVVDACGDGRRGVARQARRRDAEGRDRRLRGVRDLPGRLGVRDARGDSAADAPRCTSRSTSRGSGCSIAPSCSAGESVLIHAAAGGSGSAAIQLAVNAGARVFATAGSEAKLALCRELGARRRDQLHRERLRADRDATRPTTAASTSCSTTSARR